MGTKTLLIGLDALDPGILEKFFAAGELPVLSNLKATSREMPIENYPGFGAGVFWPSAAIGGGPDYHGRYFVRELDSNNYEINERDDRTAFEVDAFWNTLSKEGRSVGVIDWPRGPQGYVNGGMVIDNWLEHDPVGPPRSKPRRVIKKLLTEHGSSPWPGGASTIPWLSEKDFSRFFSDVRTRIEMKTKFCIEQLREKDWDLFAPVFAEPHDVGHFAFHLHDEGHPRYVPSLAKAMGDPMLYMLKTLDKACGELIEAAGEDAVIMMLGGPGISETISGNTAMDEIALRLDRGIGATASPAEQAQTTYRSLMPYWLRRTLSPIAKRVRRKALNSAFATRRFFAVPHNENAGAIRINLKGRERFGTIEPGVEYDALIAELTEALLELRDTDTGEPIVEQVVHPPHTYSGDQLHKLPDLFAVWRREHAFARITSPKIGVVENGQYGRSGDHTPYGMFWSNYDSDAMTCEGYSHPDAVAEAILEAARR